MDFKEATDGLFGRVDHDALAKALGVSVASIRQARLRPEAGAHRSPGTNGLRAADTGSVTPAMHLTAALNALGKHPTPSQVAAIGAGLHAHTAPGGR
jgi:hypothetical protein